MIVLWIWLAVGFTLLVVGADYFVSGAAALAKKWGVPSLVIGLTVVAFGTSAPELAVSVTAALRGANEIAVGNVLGSNLFNLLVVAGGSAVFAPLLVRKEILYRDWIFSILAAMLIGVQAYTGGRITRAEGLVLFLAFVCVMALQLKQSKGTIDSTTEDAPVMRPVFMILHIVLGLVGIIAGGQLAVYAAEGIARGFGVSETLIGLTVVAIGTSLPELVTSLVAARKGETDIAMGNVMGSNLFNILCILGISTLIHPITVPYTAWVDSAILTGFSILFWLFAQKGCIKRGTGVVMLLCYAGYTAYLIVR